MGLEHCDDSCSWMSLTGRRSYSREEVDKMVEDADRIIESIERERAVRKRREDVRNYFTKSLKEVYSSKYNFVIG